jgi:ornithine--oxo-acid transaminase
MAPVSSPAVHSNRKSSPKTGVATVDSYHTSSSKQALELEHEYAAHNYHPLPVVFAKALGVHVWDPEVSSHVFRHTGHAVAPTA